MKRVATLLTLSLSVVATATGCAVVAANAREERLRAALDDVRLERPLDELWPAVRHVLAERGYALAGKDAEAEGQPVDGLLSVLSRARESEATPAGGRRLETAWGGRRVRYVAEAIPDGGAWRVRFTEIQEHLTEKGHDGYAQRAPELELEVVRKFDPARAASILEEVDAPPGGRAGAPRGQ